EFAVEPESSGVDGFFVVLADLVGINGNNLCGGEGAETAQGLSVYPGGLSLAIGVESVEADLDPFAEADGFDVVDGDAVLPGVAREVGAEGEAAGGRQSPNMHDDAAAEVGADHRARLAERGAVEFAVADNHAFANGVHHRFSG